MTERQKSTEVRAAAEDTSALENADEDPSRNPPEPTSKATSEKPLNPFHLQDGRPRLQPGRLVANRFQVVRLIGRGGMGEVYEVTDAHLRDVHIALKTLLPGMARDPIMQKSFEREVLLARSLTHPNVCPIYDIFHGEEMGEPLLFLTMKLLPGETLAAKLQKHRMLPLDEATPLIRQIALGLSAAHAAGIIHRDIKTNNIILDETGQTAQVWITDFGLARLYQGETTTSNQPMLAGTPGYIAPELYKGCAATVVSDVYAFGVVVQRTLMGVSRHPDPHPEDVQSECQFLPKAWKTLIAGCLEPDPSQRFQTIDRAMASLESGKQTTKRLVRSSQTLSRRKMLVLTTGAAAAAGGIWFGVNRLRQTGPPLPEKRFVALLAWPLTENEDAPVITTLLDSIGNRLARAEAYVKDLLIISSPDIDGTPIYTASLASLATSLGANLALAASLTHTKVLMTLALLVLDTETSRTLRSGHISILPNAIAGLAERAANMAASLLDLPRNVSLSDPDELQRVSASTYHLFTEAEDLAQKPNDMGLNAAILKYQQILSESPHFALCYAQLSLAYTRQYLIQHEHASLRLADSNANLALLYNPESAKGLLSKGLSSLYSGNTDLALSYLAKATKADPENPEMLLHKARALEYLNRWQDEEQVYRQILKNRPNYWPAYNELGWNLFRQARYGEAAEAFDDAAIVAPQVALPLANLGTMLLELGRTKDAVDALTKSLKRGPNETAYLTLGDIAFSAKDYKKALFEYSRAKDLSPKNDLVWRNLGDTYAVLGKPDQMRECYDHAAHILSESLSANPSSGADWMTLAFYHAKLRNTSDAWNDLKNAEARGAADVESQFTKAQALALLGKKEEALQLVLTCLDKGLTPIEIDLALDLKDVRLDPRYKIAVAKKHAQSPPHDN